ncbi:Lhr family helicase [Desulfolutivibrio sp.]|uniref:Lhr family helicase n=1 Tax=Desulfolutivibrio sp. TaxID=2773296 RepID=UPI002F969167
MRSWVGRGRLASWRAALPQTGMWRRVTPPLAAQDRLEIEEQARERARLLLDRYGVVFRDMLVRESGAFQWGAAFRALRLLELSGEAVSGRFFDGPAGLQFLSHRGLAVFRRLFGTDADGRGRAAPGRETFWLCALDPAAPVFAGLVLPGEGAPHRPPRRAEGTHLVFCGQELALVSEGRGKDLFIGPGPDDPATPELFTPLVHLLTRPEKPLRRVAVVRINGQPAVTSPYRPALMRVFQVTADHKGLSLTLRQP